MQKNAGNTIIKNILIVVGIIGIVAALHFSGIGNLLSLENLQQHGSQLKALVDSHYFLSVLAFMGVFIALIGTLPIIIPIALLGGYLFGVVPGFIYSLTSATLGCILAFLVMRKTLTSYLQAHYQQQLADFNAKITAYGYTYLLTLHLMSVFPYIITNILASLTDIPLKTFIWTFVAGNTPLILILSFTGQKLTSIKSSSDILTPQMMLVFAALALLALIPTIIKKIQTQK
jgi:uncharacterized membrane protein YdjX (TVP38/TMEM64 family)